MTVEREKQSNNTNPSKDWEGVKNIPFKGHPFNRPKIGPEVMKRFEKAEKLRGDVLDLNINGERLSFTTLEHFDPLVARTTDSIEPSPIAEKLLHYNDKASERLLETTFGEKDWDKKMFTLINDLAKAQPIADLIEREQIRDYRELTPRQAILLTTHLVTLFTKYDERKELPEGETDADRQTAMEILKNGWQNYNNPEWQGNGMCRHFASATKAVFESLKISQKQPSQLNNTYCVLRTSKDGSEYRGYRDDDDYKELHQGGHAWNDFVQLSIDGQSAQMMSIDVTAAEYDLDTKRPLGLEWMEQRMRIPMEIIKNAVPKDDQKLQPIKTMLNKYDDMLERVLEEKRYPEAEELAHQVVELISNRNIMEIIKDQKATKAIVRAANTFCFHYLRQFDHNELATFYKVFGGSEENATMLVDRYIQVKEQSKIAHGSIYRFDDKSLQDLVNSRLAVYKAAK